MIHDRLTFYEEKRAELIERIAESRAEADRRAAEDGSVKTREWVRLTRWYATWDETKLSEIEDCVHSRVRFGPGGDRYKEEGAS